MEWVDDDGTEFDSRRIRWSSGIPSRGCIHASVERVQAGDYSGALIEALISKFMSTASPPDLPRQEGTRDRGPHYLQEQVRLVNYAGGCHWVKP
jgi:hypothetical protein